MATQYPGALDQFNNPSESSNLSDPSVLHSAQHANVNDAVEAIEAYLGTAGSGVEGTVTKRLSDAETQLGLPLIGNRIGGVALHFKNSTDVSPASASYLTANGVTGFASTGAAVDGRLAAVAVEKVNISLGHPVWFHGQPMTDASEWGLVRAWTLGSGGTDAENAANSNADKFLSYLSCPLVTGGVFDNTDILNQTMALATVLNIARVDFPPGNFGFGGEVVVPDQLTLCGAGVGESNDLEGTRFRRLGGLGKWSMTGVPSTTPGWTVNQMHRNLTMRDFSIEGNGNTPDLVVMTSCYLHEWSNIELKNCNGRLLKMTEVWDSRFNNPRFLLGGRGPTVPGVPAVSPTAFETAMGFGVGSPAVHIVSPNASGSDTSNNIYFINPRFESSNNNGMLLFMEGGNGVNIIFTNPKFEAVEPWVPLIGIDQQVCVDFGSAWVFGRGFSGPANTVPAIVAINACRGVNASFRGGWQSGTRGSTIATLNSLVKAVNCEGCDIKFDVTSYLHGFTDTCKNFFDVTGDPGSSNDFRAVIPNFVAAQWASARPGIPLPYDLPPAYQTNSQRIRPAPVVTVSAATLTLTRAHNGMKLVFTNAGGCVVTFPQGLLPGYQVLVEQAGAGSVQFIGDGTTVIRNRQSHTRTAGLYALASLSGRGVVDGNGYVLEVALSGDTQA